MQRLYFDTHAHYDEPVYDSCRDRLFEELKSLGVKGIIDPSYDPPSLERVVKIAGEYGFVKAAAGFHPQYVYDLNEADWQRLKEVLCCEKVAAAGECGLDYRGLKPVKENAAKIGMQKQAFIRQLDMAAGMKDRYVDSPLYSGKGMPVIVHSVAAAEDTYEILKEYPHLTGVIHGFSYSAEMALRFVKLGWKIGVGTAVLRPEAVRIREVLKAVPPEYLLTETDAPFLIPSGRHIDDASLIIDVSEALK